LVENIGTYDQLLKKGIKDPKKYAEERVKTLNNEIKLSRKKE